MRQGMPRSYLLAQGSTWVAIAAAGFAEMLGRAGVGMAPAGRTLRGTRCATTSTSGSSPTHAWRLLQRPKGAIPTPARRDTALALIDARQDIPPRWRLARAPPIFEPTHPELRDRNPAPARRSPPRPLPSRAGARPRRDGRGLPRRGGTGSGSRRGTGASGSRWGTGRATYGPRRWRGRAEPEKLRTASSPKPFEGARRLATKRPSSPD